MRIKNNVQYCLLAIMSLLWCNLIAQNSGTIGPPGITGDLGLDFLVSPEDYTGTDYQKLSSAVSAVSSGGIVDLERNVYVINQGLAIPKGVTIRNGTIKRHNANHTTLASALTSGSTFAKVVSTSGFFVGQRVLISTGVHLDSTSTQSSSYHTITSISNDTINFSVATVRNMPSGADFFDRFTMITAVSTDTLRIKFENVVFDGNQSNNNYIQDWTHNQMINLSGATRKKVIFDNCEWYRAPSDLIVLGSEVWINGGVMDSIWGSPLHGSITVETDNTGGVWVQNLKATNLCLSGAEINGHSGSMGFYTQSIGTGDVKISHCIMHNCNGGVIAALNSASNGMSVTDSEFRDFEFIANNISLSVEVENIRISRNDFYNCGVISLGGSFTATASVLNNVTITENDFVNSKIKLGVCRNFNISDNDFILKKNSGFSVFADYELNTDQSAIIAVAGQGGKVNDNLIICDTVFTDALEGIRIGAGGSGYRSRDFTVDNNEIVGTVIGINQAHAGNGIRYPNVGIKGNVISVRADNSKRERCLIAQSGSIVSGNSMFQGRDTTQVVLYGHTTVDSIGVQFTENKMRGSTYSGSILVNLRGNILMNNVYEGSIQNNEPTKNYVANNLNIVDSTLAELVSNVIRVSRIEGGSVTGRSVIDVQGSISMNLVNDSLVYGGDGSGRVWMSAPNGSQWALGTDAGRMIHGSVIGSAGMNLKVEQYSTTTTADNYPGYAFIDDDDTGMYLDGAGVLGFTVNDNRKLTIRDGKITLYDLSTYADDTAAGSGGLTAGDVYKTSTGELRIKL